MNPSTTQAPKCFQCGSPLIEVSKVTSHPEGSLFPQTVSSYRCSNKECQDQKDKEEAKRIKLRDEKLASDKVRDEKKAEEKQRRHDEKVMIAIGKDELGTEEAQA
ncbi:hypothetical protein BH09PAT1_BH09PAT1_5340 [soil metagenome]